jgi:hypothetical protein
MGNVLPSFGDQFCFLNDEFLSGHSPVCKPKLQGTNSLVAEELSLLFSFGEGGRHTTHSVCLHDPAPTHTSRKNAIADFRQDGRGVEGVNVVETCP